MQEPERAAPYRKEVGDEAFLRSLNEGLLPLERELEHGLGIPRFPVIFIIGAPRSGTTLVSQCLVHAGFVGYISNFVARFWQAPLVGARLERALNVRGNESIDFLSEHGVTRGLASPHEFGYFWSSWFDRGQETHKLSQSELLAIDRNALTRKVAGLETFYAAPMSFKNNTWCTFQAGYLAEVFPTALFVVCRRDPIYVAQSMLQARRKRYGSEQHWWSVRPSTYRNLLDLPWWEQVIAQALDIERDMDQAIGGIQPARVLEVDYRAFCARPDLLVDELYERLAATGCMVEKPRALAAPFQHTDTQQVAAPDWKLLQGALTSRSQ